MTISRRSVTRDLCRTLNTELFDRNIKQKCRSSHLRSLRTTVYNTAFLSGTIYIFDESQKRYSYNIA